MRVRWMPIAAAAIADGEIAASVQAGNAVVVAADRHRDTAAAAGFGVDRADAQRITPSSTPVSMLAPGLRALAATGAQCT